MAALLMMALTELAATSQPVDFATIAHRDDWIRHPVCGDPSFDAFERMPGNPIHRGAAPFHWPVNGFLFRDPVSGNWFTYVGEYAEGYAIVEEARSRCVAFRSTDDCATWESLGPVLDIGAHVFDGERVPAHAPDVSVVYADDRYHMCFDWATNNTTWQDAAKPPEDANSGVGYASASKPEGPFIPSKRPLATTRNQKTLLGKYRRLYASTLIRRAQDWLVLTLTDSGPYFGWALLGMTATQPDGPYSEPQLLLYPEMPRYHPPLLEFFPAFVHDGFIYAPSTSVALNRNFQVVFRASIENAMDPDAWEITQHGSVWHAEPIEHETFGIWGQTFSGVVHDATLRVMFPSRDEGGFGTINLASRPWQTPYKSQGFVLSGHEGPSMTFLKQGGPVKRIEANMELHGSAAILWNATGPLGPDKPASNSSLHPLMLTRYTALEISGQAWSLFSVDETGVRVPVGEGTLKEASQRDCALDWHEDGNGTITISGEKAWEGPLVSGPGRLGLWVGRRSVAAVDTFAVTGALTPARAAYLWTEGLVGAAQNHAGWEAVEDPLFRFGRGVVSSGTGLEVKWNVECAAFEIWAPRGPDYGMADVIVDGKKTGFLDFYAETPLPSSAIFVKHDIEPGFHAVGLRVREGRVPIDSLETEF